MNKLMAICYLGLVVCGCARSRPISKSTESDSSKPGETGTDDTIPDTETAFDSAAFCNQIHAADCSEIHDGPPSVPLVQLDNFGLKNAQITGVTAKIDLDNAGLGYEVGVIGLQDSGSETRAFLLVFRSNEPQVFTVNWLEWPHVDRVFGVFSKYEDENWYAIACNEKCRLIRSTATSDIPGSFEVADDVEPLPPIQAHSLAKSDTDTAPIAVGHGIARLEEVGNWSTLISAEDSTGFTAAYAIYDKHFVAVGKNGRIVSFDQDVIENIETGTNDDFVAVWARGFGDNSGRYTIIYALSAQGTAYVTNAYGQGTVCSFLENPVTFIDGYDLTAVSANGGIFHISNNVFDVHMCPNGSIGSEISGATSVRCGIHSNVIAWNRQQIFANSEAGCAID